MKKYNDIKDVFAAHLGHINFNEKFFTSIEHYRIGIVNKSDDFTDFVGSGLVGAHNIVFSSVDEDTFYIEVLGVDVNLLRIDLHALDEVIVSRKVTSNVFYLTISYLLYAATKATLNKELKSKFISEIYYVFAYKVLTSIYSYYFKHTVPNDIAKAVYEKLSNRYLIKRLGNWGAVLEYRANDVKIGGIHYKRLLSYDTESALIIIQDLQGRLREMIKDIYPVLIEVKESKEKIGNSTTIEAGDEDDSIKSVTDRHDVLINYVNSIIHNDNDFIVDDLVYLLSTMVKNVDADKLKTTLRYISNLDLTKTYPNLVTDTIEITIRYIGTKGVISGYSKNVYDILGYMKGYWSSSSSSKSKDVSKLKKDMLEITKKATGKKTKWLLTTISITVLLYIFLRAVYKNK